MGKLPSSFILRSVVNGGNHLSNFHSFSSSSNTIATHIKALSKKPMSMSVRGKGKRDDGFDNVDHALVLFNKMIGRPSGTDGYDFSYRMVVDSRYQKVARTKSILCSFFLVQAITLLLGLVLLIFQSASEDLASRGLEISTTACVLISLIIGELGRKRSRVNMLRFFMVASSIAVSLLMFCAIRKCSRLMAAKSPSYWETILELPEVALAVVGLVFHLFIIGYTVHLIANMSVPKRAS